MGSFEGFLWSQIKSKETRNIEERFDSAIPRMQRARRNKGKGELISVLVLCLFYQLALSMRISVKKCALFVCVAFIICNSKKTWRHLSHTQYSFSFLVYTFQKSQNLFVLKWHRYWRKARVFFNEKFRTAHFYLSEKF